MRLKETKEMAEEEGITLLLINTNRGFDVKVEH